jgi:hypothetical protein
VGGRNYEDEALNNMSLLIPETLLKSLQRVLPRISSLARLDRLWLQAYRSQEVDARSGHMANPNQPGTNRPSQGLIITNVQLLVCPPILRFAGPQKDEEIHH